MSQDPSKREKESETAFSQDATAKAILSCFSLGFRKDACKRQQNSSVQGRLRGYQLEEHIQNRGESMRYERTGTEFQQVKRYNYMGPLKCTVDGIKKELCY